MIWPNCVESTVKTQPTNPSSTFELNRVPHQLQLQNVCSVLVFSSSSTTTGWSYSIVGNALRSPGGVGGTSHRLTGSRWHELCWQSSCWCVSFWRTWLHFLNRSTALVTAILAANTTHTYCINWSQSDQIITNQHNTAFVLFKFLK